MTKTIAFCGALLLSTAASAQAPSNAAPAEGGAGNPNDRICRTLNDTGSRLSRSRVCLTRAEWAERRRVQRQALEQSQRGNVRPTN